MHASRAASAGTRASSSALNDAPVHQQGGCATPVARATSLAQRFGWPQSGQRVGSMPGITTLVSLASPYAAAFTFSRHACSSGSV